MQAFVFVRADWGSATIAGAVLVTFVFVRSETPDFARLRHVLGLQQLALGRIRGTLKREPLLNPLLALLNRDLIQRVYMPKGPPNPIPYLARVVLGIWCP